MNSLSIIIIFSKSKTLRYEYLTEIILIILGLYKFKKSFSQISDYINVLKATIAYIVFWSIQNLK